MEKIKRIFSLIIIIVLCLSILATLICAVMGWDKAFTACAWTIVVAPVFLYVLLLLIKLSKK